MEDMLAARQLAAIRSVSCDLDAMGVRHWLIGGWAIDHHAGGQTRTHRDVDLAVPFEHRSRVAGVLIDGGFSAGPRGPSTTVESFQDGALEIEFTYIVAGPNGCHVTPGYESWPWPEGTFGDDQGSIGGCRVPVASLIGLLTTKQQWEREVGEPLRDHDRHDIELMTSLVRIGAR